MGVCEVGEVFGLVEEVVGAVGGVVGWVEVWRAGRLTVVLGAGRANAGFGVGEIH